MSLDRNIYTIVTAFTGWREITANNKFNLAKIDDGLAESPTVIVGDKNNKTTW